MHGSDEKLLKYIGRTAQRVGPGLDFWAYVGGRDNIKIGFK